MWHEKLATMSVLSGTHTPARCPAGTYSNGTGLVAEYQCTNCTAGYYCQNTGLTSEQGLCQAGYYCPQGMCVCGGYGYYCPQGEGGYGYYCLLWKEGMATTAHKVRGYGFYYPQWNGVWPLLPTRWGGYGYYCPQGEGGMASTAHNEMGYGHYCPLGEGVWLLLPTRWGGYGYYCPLGEGGTVSVRPTTTACKMRWVLSASSYTVSVRPATTAHKVRGYCQCQATTAHKVRGYCQCQATTAHKVRGYCQCQATTAHKVRGYCQCQATTAHKVRGVLSVSGYYCPQGEGGTVSVRLLLPTRWGGYCQCQAGGRENDAPIETKQRKVENEYMRLKTSSCVLEHSTCNRQCVNAHLLLWEYLFGRCWLQLFSQCTVVSIQVKVNELLLDKFWWLTCTLNWYEYFLVTGSAVMNAIICPIGLHCPEGSDEPISCAPGYFTNRTGMSSCDICPDGWVCEPFLILL